MRTAVVILIFCELAKNNHGDFLMFLLSVACSFIALSQDFKELSQEVK